MECKFELHCLSFPFPSECFDYCMEQALHITNLEEKEYILRLDHDLALKLSKVYNNYRIGNFDDLKKRLNQDEVDSILDTFHHLDQSQVEYFSKSKKEKQAIIDNIKGSNLNI